MKTVFCLSLAIFALTSCTSTGPDTGGNAGYYSADPVSPVDRATNLQNRIGASTRSLY